MHFLVGPDVFTLVVRDNVEALPECLLDAAFVVFDAGHDLRVPRLAADPP